jgi:hypothetical protein
MMALYLVEIDSSEIFDKNSDVELRNKIQVNAKITQQFFTDTPDTLALKLEVLEEIKDAIEYAEDEDLILANITKILKQL